MVRTKAVSVLRVIEKYAPSFLGCLTASFTSALLLQKKMVR